MNPQKKIKNSETRPARRRRRGRAWAALAAASALLVSLLAAFPAAAAYDLPEDVSVSAKAALVVSLGATQAEDTVLYELDADAMKSPAALVRLMVGAVAIRIIREQEIDLDKTTGTYTIECFNRIAGTGLTTANMEIGETWTVRDLLSMSMIQTAADACVTLAVTLSGSEDQFVAEMNALAQEIGCENTSFANVSGIDHINQYTSARDIYRIMRYAMDYPEYEALLSATEYTAQPVSGGKGNHSLPNTNEMSRPSSSYYYSPMAYGKTGYTDSAGRCLASVARDSGYEYLVVVLGCPEKDSEGQSGVHFRDTKALYRWAFNSFTYKTLLSKNEPIAQLPVRLAWDRDTVTLVPETNFSATVANDLDPSTILKKETLNVESVDAPVAKGEVYGKVELFINVDQKIGEVNLVASESVERSEILSIWAQVQSFLTSPWFYGGLALLAVLLVGYIILNIVHNRRRRRNRMQRLKKYK
ncbi:MAG TPA: D-alanyl-D-alanine carboxypeptidase [Firmicutes bacterium]|nr:D-alanyl-D-alanine carboxypeptidase [Bacillota bacterium]